jgi:hypothetical protein
LVLTICVQDGQYHIHTRAVAGEPAWPDTSNGLLIGEATWVAVLTGTQWGPVTFTMRPLDRRPTTIDPGWDMIAEWSLDTADGMLAIQATYGGGTTVTTPGEWTRIRVSVRNRLAAARRNEAGEAVLNEPVEEHLIQYWPTEHAEGPAVLAGPDDVATSLLEQQEQLRREYGGGAP